jgi:two-component system sensor histidine kinase/response regulator
MQGDREQCLATGMDDYLAKPFTQEQLHAILERWLPPTRTGEAQAPLVTSPSLEQLPAPDTIEAAPVPTLSALSPAPLDRAVLDNLRALQRQGASNLFDKVIQRYLDQTPQLVQTLRAAVCPGDAPTVLKVAIVSRLQQCQCWGNCLSCPLQRA